MVEVSVMRLDIRFRFPSRYVVAGLLFSAVVASAQNTGWRRLNVATDQTTDPSTPVARDNAENPPPPPPAEVAAQVPAPAGQVPAPAGAPMPHVGIPSQLTIQPGTFVTIRVDQPLSSDRNQPGDFFSGTLAGPLVIDGVVAAQRGQTVAGRVTTVHKGGHGKGSSQLGIELTAFTAVDGQQVPLQTQLVTRAARSRSDPGRDVATVGTTTMIGAVIGSAADWGTGAAIGAGFGAMAGLAGVLLTPGAPAVIYPESVLTFRVQAPVSISTDRAPQAFRYVEPGDYQQPQVVQSQMQRPPRPAPYYAPYPYPYPYPYAYSYPYPYYWGPSFGVIIGPRYGWGWGGYYRGFRR